MRYDPVTQEVKDALKICIETYFPELGGAGIMLIFDTKKRVSKGRTILAQIRKANDVEKFLTLDDATFEDGPDYIIFIDKFAWELGTPADRMRLMRHELRHTHVENDAAKPFKLRGHTVEDFYEEIALNNDMPRWAEDLGLRVMAAYGDNVEHEETITE
jgi:hypothetical protein